MTSSLKYIQLVAINGIKNLLLKAGGFLGVVAHVSNPSTLGGQVRHIMRSEVQNQPGQHGETSSLLKIQKLAGCGGGCL